MQKSQLLTYEHCKEGVSVQISTQLHRGRRYCSSEANGAKGWTVTPILCHMCYVLFRNLQQNNSTEKDQCRHSQTECESFHYSTCPRFSVLRFRQTTSRRVRIKTAFVKRRLMVTTSFLNLRNMSIEVVSIHLTCEMFPFIRKIYLFRMQVF